MFERLRAAIRAALGAALPPPHPRAGARDLHDALVRARMALEALRQDLSRSEQQLAIERRHLEDAERRGRLAAGIGDQETVAVAERFAVKHRQRLLVLERKLEAQRAELMLADREYDDLKATWRRREQEGPGEQARHSAAAAWRAVEAAGGTRPETDLDGEVLGASLDRAAREARAEEQLQALKKKMERPSTG